MTWLRVVLGAAETLAVWLRRRRSDKAFRRARVALDTEAQRQREIAYQAQSAAAAGRRATSEGP